MDKVKPSKKIKGLIGLVMMLGLVIVLSGCSAGTVSPSTADPAKTYESINKNLSVSGITLGMTEADLTKAQGAGEKENCVYGYELNYPDKNLSIGVNTSGWVRRIKTADPATSIYGVNPGMSLTEAEKLVKAAGYTVVPETKKFEHEGLRIELLSKENKLADQISIEIIEK